MSVLKGKRKNTQMYICLHFNHVNFNRKEME
jgi:hypothetical protein